MSESLKSLFSEYYSNLVGKNISISSLERVFGGASRETYKILVSDASGNQEKLVLRLSQDSSLIETEQKTEYLAYTAFQNSNVPVPELIDMNEGAEILGKPFMLMKELEGQAANPFSPNIYAPYEKELGKQFWFILGQIASKKIDDKIFKKLSLDTQEPHWKIELDKWVKVINEDSIGMEPVLEAGIRYLYENSPKLNYGTCLVHGDYRSGNFLYLKDKITGILDWEMAHIGDPLEDLAWALSPIWSWQDKLKPAYLISREEAVKIWQDSSKISADQKYLDWWELFAAIKGMAIWTSAGHEFKTGTNIDPINLFSAWIPGDIHLEIILDFLEAKL